MQTRTAPLTPLSQNHWINDHWPDCAGGSLVGYDEDADELLVIPTTCGRWDCPDCSTHKARVYAAKIFAAAPERAITLTWDPKVHPSPAVALSLMKEALPRLATAIRKQGITFEYACVWEIHKSGMPHCHLATWGDYIPQDFIKRTWFDLTGATIVHISSLARHSADAHNWCKYLTKADSFPDSLFNGFRRVTFSRKYHRFPPKLEPVETDRTLTWFWTTLHGPDLFQELERVCLFRLSLDDGRFLAQLRTATTSTPINRHAIKHYLEGK